MKATWTIFLSVSALLVATPCRSEPFYLAGYYLGSESESSRLNINCQGESDAKITCSFLQVTLGLPDAAKIEASRAARYAEFSSSLKEKSFQSTCKEVEAHQASPKMASLPQSAKELVEDLLRVCREQTEASFRTFVDHQIANELVTCKVSLYDGTEVELYKVNATTWANRPKPEGMCDSVTSMILQRESAESNLLTWKQVRTYIDRSNEFCKKFETDKPTVWSWKGTDTVEANCKFIKFGLF